jgi:Ca2+-binding RTX toxin-like protein
VLSGNDSITGGNLADYLEGFRGSDKLTGRGGNDTLLGYEGNDRLWGGAGRDTLRGHQNDDTFLFARASESRSGAANRDAILDFDDFGNDVMDLRGLSSQVLIYRGGASINAAGQVRIVDVSGPDVLVQVNLDADTSTIETEIVLKSTFYADMTKSDFLL